MCSVLPECLFLGLTTNNQSMRLGKNLVSKKQLLSVALLLKLEHMKFPPTFLGCQNWSVTIPDQLELFLCRQPCCGGLMGIASQPQLKETISQQTFWFFCCFLCFHLFFLHTPGFECFKCLYLGCSYNHQLISAL